MSFGINVLLALMIIGSFLVAIALHEWGHALVSSWLGDSTARADGRQTLRIAPHVDTIGLLMCIVLAFQPIMATPVGLGWSKPIRTDPWKMRLGANAGVLAVAWAGPIFNLLIGLLTAVIVRFSVAFLIGNCFTEHLLQLFIVFASVNIALTLLNLLPLYPLDGYQILYTLLPSKQAVQFSKSAPYGQFIILGLFFLLPFIARLANVSDFPPFNLAYYIWLGSVNLIALVIGQFPASALLVQHFYLLK